MNNFEKKYGVVEEIEAQAKLICEGRDGDGGVFAEIDNLVLDKVYGRCNPPYYLEDLLAQYEPTLRQDIPYGYTYEMRKRAMRIYRVAMKAIYARYEVNPTKSVAHVEFRSSISEPEQTTFMGVSAIGYRDEGEIYVKVEHFGSHDIGFVERYAYSKKENTGAGVISTAGHPAVVGHPYASDIESDAGRAVPYNFELSVYEVENGKLIDDLY